MNDHRSVKCGPTPLPDASEETNSAGSRQDGYDLRRVPAGGSPKGKNERLMITAGLAFCPLMADAP